MSINDNYEYVSTATAKPSRVKKNFEPIWHNCRFGTSAAPDSGPFPAGRDFRTVPDRLQLAAGGVPCLRPRSAPPRRVCPVRRGFCRAAVV